MARKIFIGGNWKCVSIVDVIIMEQNGTKKSIEELIAAFNNAGELKADRDIVIAPTALHIGLAQSLLRKEIEVAAQNIWKVNVFCLYLIFIAQGYGAFTGELSAPMLKGISCLKMVNVQISVLTGLQLVIVNVVILLLLSLMN